MTRFTTERRPIWPAALHAVAKFSVMRVRVARRAGPVLKMKRKDFVFSASCASLVAFHASHGDVGTGQRKFRRLMFCDREERSVEICHGVARLTSILEWLPSKLAVMGILMTVHAVREFDLVDCCFAGGNVAFPTFHLHMHSLQWIF